MCALGQLPLHSLHVGGPGRQLLELRLHFLPLVLRLCLGLLQTLHLAGHLLVVVLQALLVLLQVGFELRRTNKY